MLFENILPLEIPIMESFIKFKVKEILNSGILTKDIDQNSVPKVEVPYIVRFFLQFPSQSQVVDEIIPEIEKLEVDDEKSKDIIKLDAFEKYLINLLKLNLYPSYEKEILMEAFRVLDSDKLGYIDLHTFYAFMKSYGVSLTKEQIKEMERFLVENETDFLEPLKLKSDTDNRPKQNQYTTRKFYYESYVRKVVIDNKKHFQCLIAEYKFFLDEYKKQKELEKQIIV